MFENDSEEQEVQNENMLNVLVQQDRLEGFDQQEVQIKRSKRSMTIENRYVTSINGILQQRVMMQYALSQNMIHMSAAERENDVSTIEEYTVINQSVQNKIDQYQQRIDRQLEVAASKGYVIAYNPATGRYVMKSVPRGENVQLELPVSILIHDMVVTYFIDLLEKEGEELLKLHQQFASAQEEQIQMIKQGKYLDLSLNFQHIKDQNNKIDHIEKVRDGIFEILSKF